MKTPTHREKQMIRRALVVHKHIEQRFREQAKVLLARVDKGIAEIDRYLKATAPKTSR